MGVKYDNPKDNPKYCGEVFAKDLDKMIPVYHRAGEPCEDALVRVELAHSSDDALRAEPTEQPKTEES
jgi:hypothetical protein